MSDTKYINKINALMAQASDASTTPEHRENLLAKAEELRLNHAIDMALVDPENKVKREGIIEVAWKIDMPDDFAEQVRYIFNAILWHCGLRGIWTWGKENLKVIGFESDVRYAEMLWPMIYMEFAGNLFPAWRGERTFDENVYAFVKGGFKWRLIADTANKHGAEVPWPDGGRLIRAYRRACKARGEEPTKHTQRHEAFRASYANSFRSTISSRLRAMKEQAEGTVDDKDRLALALRSKGEQVDAEFYRMYPQWDPANLRKQNAEYQASEEARRAAMTQEERDAEDAAQERQRQRDRKYWSKLNDKSYDANGWAHGTAVARNVDLSMGKGHITPNRAEVTR